MAIELLSARHTLAMVRPKIAILSLAETSMGMASQQMVGDAAARSRRRCAVFGSGARGRGLSLAASSDAAEEQKPPAGRRRCGAACPGCRQSPGRFVRPLPHQLIRPGLVAPNIGARETLRSRCPTTLSRVQRPHRSRHGSAASVAAEPLRRGTRRPGWAEIWRPAIRPPGPDAGDLAPRRCFAAESAAVR